MDLVLRDLGYFSLNVLSKIVNKGAFFISRYRYGTTIYDEHGNKIDLLKYLSKYGQLDQTLLINRG